MGSRTRFRREASRAADLTVAFLHWGLELSNEGTGAQRRVAERLIDAGADLMSMLAARSRGVVWQSEDVAVVAGAGREATRRAVTRPARIDSRDHSSSE